MNCVNKVLHTHRLSILFLFQVTLSTISDDYRFEIDVVETFANTRLGRVNVILHVNIVKPTKQYFTGESKIADLVILFANDIF